MTIIWTNAEVSQQWVCEHDHPTWSPTLRQPATHSSCTATNKSSVLLMTQIKIAPNFLRQLLQTTLEFQERLFLKRSPFTLQFLILLFVFRREWPLT